MAEQALVRMSVVTEALVLRPLIAPRNAARVALGRLHLRPAPVELRLAVFLSLGALARTALRVLAVRRHRSSIEVVNRAYHVTTG